MPGSCCAVLSYLEDCAGSLPLQGGNCFLVCRQGSHTLLAAGQTAVGWGVNRDPIPKKFDIVGLSGQTEAFA